MRRQSEDNVHQAETKSQRLESKQISGFQTTDQFIVFPLWFRRGGEINRLLPAGSSAGCRGVYWDQRPFTFCLQDEVKSSHLHTQTPLQECVWPAGFQNILFLTFDPENKSRRQWQIWPLLSRNNIWCLVKYSSLFFMYKIKFWKVFIFSQNY